MATNGGNLNPGQRVHGIFQNLKLEFKVSKNQPTGPNLWLDHDNGQVHVRKQDIRDGQFELEVKRRP
ncbi:MAG: hypothetical protein WA748_19445 [Candidatus Acidiferrum sp.]